MLHLVPIDMELETQSEKVLAMDRATIIQLNETKIKTQLN